MDATAPRLLAARIHDRIVPRLCSVALVLGAEGKLPDDLRKRCETELTTALMEMRTLLLSSIDEERGAPSLAAEIRRWHRSGAPVSVVHGALTRVPAELEALLCEVLREAVRNALRHASPSEVRVEVGLCHGQLRMLVLSDGVSPVAATAVGLGVGLRIVAAAAESHAGTLSWGRVEGERWKVQLTVPMPSS